MSTASQAAAAPVPKKMSLFDRYLTVWVALCMGLGVLIGKLLPEPVAAIRGMEISHINLPIAALIWLMIYPMIAYFGEDDRPFR